MWTPRRGACHPQYSGVHAYGATPAIEGDALFAQLLLEPFVAIQAYAGRIRQVSADLDECRSPFRVLQIEVVLLDGDRLAREREAHHAWRHDVLGRLE